MCMKVLLQVLFGSKYAVRYKKHTHNQILMVSNDIKLEAGVVFITLISLTAIINRHHIKITRCFCWKDATNMQDDKTFEL